MVAGIPSVVIGLNTLHPIFASVHYWAESGREAAGRQRFCSDTLRFLPGRGDCRLNDAANPCVHVLQSLQYVDRAASSLISSGTAVARGGIVFRPVRRPSMRL